MVQKIRLIPDQYHLTELGQLDDGNYFWIDVQLSSEGRETRDFVATYIFDKAGDLIDHKINDLGLRSSPEARSVKKVIEQEIASLGRWSRRDFWVKPFEIKSHG